MPLTSVVWTSKTEVVVGSETGRLIRVDVNDKTVKEEVVVDLEGDPVLCLVSKVSQSVGVSEEGRR